MKGSIDTPLRAAKKGNLMILFHDVTWELKGFVGVAKVKIYIFI